MHEYLLDAAAESKGHMFDTKVNYMEVWAGGGFLLTPGL
jgi:hypothetical protein